MPQEESQIDPTTITSGSHLWVSSRKIEPMNFNQHRELVEANSPREPSREEQEELNAEDEDDDQQEPEDGRVG